MGERRIYRCAVLIAAYNAAEMIGPVVVGARPFSPDIVVVVDDGSTDETGEIADEFADVVLRHENNRGKGAALITGLTYLKDKGYDAAVTLDADGQHSPECIPWFITRHRETACELVLGHRPFAVQTMPFLRLAGNLLSSFWVSFACRSKILDSQCGFRLYCLANIRLDLLTTRGFDTETEILLQTRRRGGRIEQVEVPLIYKAGGRSHFRRLNDTFAVARIISRYLFGGGKGRRS